MTDVDAPLMRIGRHRIGGGAPCLVIAELGINHNGSRAQAMALIDAAVDAGADAVKMQKRSLPDTYRADVVANPRNAEQSVQYLIPILIESELSDNDFRAVRAHAASRGISFLCTPWDEPSVAFLEALDVAAYKVGSPDLTNAPLVDRVARTGRPMIVSTGMSTEAEIRRALGQLAATGAEYAVLHCVSAYPATPDEINLRFMQTLREWSGRPVGYSGHETGISVSCAAVAMGACILERHLTLDRSQRGPDHRASLEPSEFAALVRATREIELAQGTPRRWMTRGEMLNRRALAKSLVAARDIPAGTTITRDMVAAKGPGLGVSPQEMDRLLNHALARDLRRDEPFHTSDLHEAHPPLADTSAIDVGAAWGVVARFTDFAALAARFVPLGMRFVEFHLSDGDLDAGGQEFTLPLGLGLVLHAPEYRGDTILDLCSADGVARELAVVGAQRVVDLARTLARGAALDISLFPRGPKIVIHAGGMGRPGEPYDADVAMTCLRDSMSRIDATGVELLLENLPPQPWYFGGRSEGHVMCDAENIVRACEASGVGLCFDTSHAALECAARGAGLADFVERVRPLVRHLHVSDAAGVSGEGLQVGEGAINFVEILPRLVAPGMTLVPEIWMGHHEVGEGFHVALQRLTELRWAREVITRGPESTSQAVLDTLVVTEAATVFGALRAIDANRMGIVFVLDASRRVIGVATDGDIRHAFVRGLGLHSPIREVMTREFVFGTPGMSRDEVRARLPGRTRVMPVLDGQGRLVDVENLWTIGDQSR